MKLSIILPVYNVAKFIPDCLDSLLCQDLPKDEYEIICVNDGSPDNSVEVIEGYAKLHSNIKIISQPNSASTAAIPEPIWCMNTARSWWRKKARRTTRMRFPTFVQKTQIEKNSVGENKAEYALTS